MCRLQTPQLEEALKDYPLYSQDGKGKEAICRAIFALGSARWFILEGEREGDDTIMFGVVTGLIEGSTSGYGYGPMAIDPLSGDNWLVCFADEQYWGHSQIYFASYSSDGNENWRVPVGPICSVDDYVTYLEGSDYYLFWVDEETDDDWNTFYSIKSVKMSDIDTGIRSIDADAATSGDTRYYDLNGIRLSQPQNGLNIIRESDGTVKKVLVRK